MLSTLKIIQVNIGGITSVSKHMDDSPSRSLTDQDRWTQTEGAPSIKKKKNRPTENQDIHSLLDRLEIAGTFLSSLERDLCFNKKLFSDFVSVS